MNRLKKIEALEFIQTLQQTHQKLSDFTNSNSKEQKIELLVNCQQEVIEFGTMIEQLEGENSPLIKILEEYCEEIYQIYEIVSHSTSDAFDEENYINLNRLLIKIEHSIKNDIKERLEVVFLPYNASMWDSLESVWKAADEDPDCDAYVIPIPYIDKKMDGTVRETHWDGQLFPQYVPITKYNEYNFEERHPDMIFIHNPYDDNNYVTSVHPFFYVKNLLNFTDKLIYIPYFVVNEKRLYEQWQLESLATANGVLFADKVIVQSEVMRQMYINILMKHFEDKRFWENKILGFGSPKIDKLYRNANDVADIPEEWKEIIEDKIVVFYNTTVTALLLGNDQYVKKIRDVFETFMKYENVVLLWRPHPLLESTIHAMRNDLYENYIEIKNKFICDKKGIFDDTSDLHRSIKISDAYFGDSSSVDELFRQTGKPVMIQSAEILYQH